MHTERHLERRETLAYWPARDNETGEAVGLVTDLTEEGVQIHSQHEFLKGQMLTIRIKLDPRLIGMDQISLVIENAWCRASGISGLYHAGFKVVDISDRARTSIRTLLKAFSYPAPSEGGL